VLLLLIGKIDFRRYFFKASGLAVDWLKLGS